MFTTFILERRRHADSYAKPAARDDNLRASWGCTPKPLNLTKDLATPALNSSEVEEAAMAQLASKLGFRVGFHSRRQKRASSSSASSSPEDDSFIRTPPTGPSLTASPELSPPPAYDSLSGIPDLPGGVFALPPPALSSSSSKSDQGPSTTAGTGSASLESKTVILYVGRISWEKNIRLLIEAFKLLPSPVRAAAKLVFVGDGPARGDLTRLCARYGLDATFMGHQKGKRLAAMYASSSVFAFPSFTETFGQVVLEALASGLPVVGLHAEGTSDLVTQGRTGLLLDVKAAAASSSSSAIESSPKKSTTSLANSSPRLRALRQHSQSSSSSSPSGSSTPAVAATAAVMADFAEAATTAASKLRPSYERSPSSSKIHQAPTSGLAAPIPSVADFAAAMSPSSAAFQSCARSYSILLERLVRDRALRGAMGERAQLVATRKTWWDAMDAVVRGYEEVVERAGLANLTDEELEALRASQQKKAPLTGPIVRLCVILYLVLFALLCKSLF